MQDVQGLSAIELLISIALAALLSVISLAGLSAQRKATLLQLERSAVVWDLRALVLRATQSRARISLQIAPHYYRAVRWTENNAIPLLERRLTHLLHAQGDAEGNIEFYPSGVVSPITLELAGETKRCLITLSLRGRVLSTCEAG